MSSAFEITLTIKNNNEAKSLPVCRQIIDSFSTASVGIVDCSIRSCTKKASVICYIYILATTILFVWNTKNHPNKQLLLKTTTAPTSPNHRAATHQTWN